MLRRISRDQVKLGMYIHAFDGPWLRHPFWLRRFLLSSPEDLKTLLESDIATLVIDESRGVPLTVKQPVPIRAEPGSAPKSDRPPPPPSAPKSIALPVRRPINRPCSTSEERERATRVPVTTIWSTSVSAWAGAVWAWAVAAKAVSEAAASSKFL